MTATGPNWDEQGRRCPRQGCGAALLVSGEGFLFCSAIDCTWGLDGKYRIDAGDPTTGKRRTRPWRHG